MHKILTLKARKFTLGAFALVLLSITGWATDKMKAYIHIYDAVHVGSIELAPGEYQITWTANGTNAEVTFTQGKRVVASVPAQLTEKRSGYDGPGLYTDTVSKALTEVELPKVSLSFTSDNASRDNSAN